MNRWFTRYLYGVEKDPKAWVVRESDPIGRPTPYPDCPNPAAKLVALFPTKGGRKQGGLALAARTGEGRETLVDDVALSGAKLAAEKDSTHRLLYASPALKEPVHLSGTGKITLKVAANCPVTNLSV